MHACKPMLVGMASPEFSEILLLFVCLQIWPNFPFETSTIVHGGWQKIELAQKIMQVEVIVKCMQTNFGGHGLSSYEDIATF